MGPMVSFRVITSFGCVQVCCRTNPVQEVLYSTLYLLHYCCRLQVYCSLPVGVSMRLFLSSYAALLLLYCTPATMSGNSNNNANSGGGWWQDAKWEEADGGPPEVGDEDACLSLPTRIPCSIKHGNDGWIPIRTAIDFDAKQTVMDPSTAKKLGLLSNRGSVDGELSLNLEGSVQIRVPAVGLMEEKGESDTDKNGHQLILGSELLDKYRAVRNSDEGVLELTVDSKKHRVTFIQSRGETH